MSKTDPTRHSGDKYWYVDEDNLKDTSAEALLLDVSHLLRQSSAVAMGFAQHLAMGEHGFTSTEQEEDIKLLYQAIQETDELRALIDKWLAAHRATLTIPPPFTRSASSVTS